MVPINVSPHSPPGPGRGQANMGKQVIKSSLYYAKPGQIPQYGANISGQIRVKFPHMSGARGGGGEVGQHIGGCI